MKIKGQLKSIWPDRTQYKPYAYNLEMQNVFVEIEIPEEGGVVKELFDTSEAGVYNVIGNEVTLNLNGFSCLLGQVADSLDKLHSQYIKSFQR